MLTLTEERRALARVRWLLLFFGLGLMVSGLTAIPLETEIRQVTRALVAAGLAGTDLHAWLERVQTGLIETNVRFPFIAYGTDWLAFAHVVIAIAFIGPWRDPIKNRWVIEFGMIACVLIVPFALCMGGVRGIPFGWRLIDCSFGILGIVPLWLSRKEIRRLELAIDARREISRN